MKKLLIIAIAVFVSVALVAQPLPSGRGVSSVATVPGSVSGTGTITTAGTTAIVGVGTTFTSLRVGQWLVILGESAPLKIASIANATHLTLASAAGTTASGLSWSYSECTYGPVVELSTVTARLSYQCVNGLYTAIPTSGGGASGIAKTGTTTGVLADVQGTSTNNSTLPVIKVSDANKGGAALGISGSDDNSDNDIGINITGENKGVSYVPFIGSDGAIGFYGNFTSATASGMKGVLISLGASTTTARGVSISNNSTDVSSIGVQVGGTGGGPGLEIEGSSRATTSESVFLLNKKGGGTAAIAADATMTGFSISEAQSTFTDITTNNATTSLHGYLPKLGGGTANFLRADGSWAAPAGGATTTLNNLGTTAINADLKTGAGTAFNITATPPAQTTNAQAGINVSIKASDAVDGVSGHAAQVGGFISLTAGTGVNKSGNTQDGQVIIVGSGNTTMGANFIPLLSIGNIANTLAQNGVRAYNNGGGLVFGYGGVTKSILADGLYLTSDAQITISSSTSDPSLPVSRISGCGTVKCWQFGDPNDGGSVQHYVLSGFNAKSGTDTGGSNITIAGGYGTGAGAPGDVVLHTPWPGSTGTTAQTLYTDRLYLRAMPKTLTDGTATGFTEINVPSGAACSGEYTYNVTAIDSTESQAQGATVQWAAQNNAGTVTVRDNATAGIPPNLVACACSSGTLSESVSEVVGASKFTIKLNATSSLKLNAGYLLRASWRVAADGGPCTVSPLS